MGKQGSSGTPFINKYFEHSKFFLDFLVIDPINNAKF